MEQKIIFFDFFGVICSEIAPIWLESLYDKQIAFEIKESVFSIADIGDIDENETLEILSNITNISIETIREEWQKLEIINMDLLSLIKSLSKKYPIYLLSNAISSHIRNILDKNSLNDLFNKIYISSEIKAVKPNIDFFEYVLNDLNCNPSNAIMIDDNARNIEGAASVGIKGIVYTDIQMLINKLLNLGIVI